MTTHLAPQLDDLALGRRRTTASAFAQLFSFEVSFTLFLFAGLFKADPRLTWVPFDLTAAFFALSVSAGILVLARRRFALGASGLAAVGAMAAFAAWLALSLTWSQGSVYAQEKALHVVVLNGWALAAAALIIGPSRRRRSRFLACVVVFAAVVAIEGVRSYLLIGPRNFLNPLGGHYIGIGRVLGLATCVAVTFALSRGFGPIARSALLVLAALFVFVMLTSGARGPLLATALSLAMLIPLGFRLSPGVRVTIRRHLPRFLLLLVAGAAIALGFSDNLASRATTVARLRLLFTQDGGGASAVGRVDFYQAAVEYWTDSPLVGHGTGSFPVMYGLGDVRGYPHNLFLEVLVEQGLVGVSLLLILLVTPFMGLGRNWASWFGDPQSVVVLLIFVVVLLNAQVSGDLTDNRPLFMAVGLLAGSVRTATRRVGGGGSRSGDSIQSSTRARLPLASRAGR